MQAFDENAQNTFGRRHFGNISFLQSQTRVCFLTKEMREQNSFKLVIARWFNPTVFSTFIETGISLQAR